MKLIPRDTCPFCKSEKVKTLFKIKYRDKKLSNFLLAYYKSEKLNEVLENYDYEIIKCNVCKGIFQKNVPDPDFADYLYDKCISVDESFKKKINFDKINYLKLEEDYNLIKQLLDKDKNIDILEFGCGWGHWSKFMQSKGFNLITCEFSKKRHQYLTDNGIINYQNISDIKKRFDLIYTEEVLEHLSDPIETLIKLSKLLKNDGFMIHKFPSSKFFQLKLNFNYVPKKDCAHPLEHINLFNKKCFVEICKKLNLNLIQLNNIKNQNLRTKIKILKNNYLFNFVVLQKVT